MKTIQCRVCLHEGATFYMSVTERGYWRCQTCAAVFLDASQLPDVLLERGRYLLHQNDPNDPAYRRFLSRLSVPLLKRLGSPREGLDYGCGPGPALARVLAEAGHVVRLYDPFFHPDATALSRTYDFITCTEVAEHFHRPAQEFDRLNVLLRPGGWLAVMTRFMTEATSFSSWHYRRDPTHVVFYRQETFRHLASKFHWHCDSPAENVVFMRKGAHDAGEY